MTNKIKKRSENRNQSGFTLIEILVVIGLIAFLAAVVIIAINPARQFAQGRNSQRVSNVNAVLNAIGQNIADNKGIFDCASTTLPAAAMMMNDSGGYDIRDCIVPTYISELPADPVGGKACADAGCSGGYNTEYTVLQDANGRITVCAPKSKGETAIEADPKEICVTR
ncbi:MAG: type II secretion system protein [Minisyncoccales bacterium]